MPPLSVTVQRVVDPEVITTVPVGVPWYCGVTVAVNTRVGRSP